MHNTMIVTSVVTSLFVLTISFFVARTVICAKFIFTPTTTSFMASFAAGTYYGVFFR